MTIAVDMGRKATKTKKKHLMCSVFVILFDKSRYLIELLTQNASALVPGGVRKGFINTRRKFLTEGISEPSNMNIE